MTSETRLNLPYLDMPTLRIGIRGIHTWSAPKRYIFGWKEQSK